MTLLSIVIIAFAFFAQSLLGFGGGLISIPLLSLFMPVQDVVTMVSIFQISMGWLLVKIHKDVSWLHIKRMIPATIIGVALGIFLLNYLSADVMRIVLATYIILHLLRTHTKIDPLGRVIKAGGVHLASGLGGTINAMIGGGGPAFILYLKDKAKNTSEFRANITAILFLSNIPRLVGTLGTEMMTWQIFMMAVMAYPGFLLALVLGQKLHSKVPQKRFFTAIEVLLACSALFLILKVVL